MNYITFYRSDFVLDSEGNSMFDSLLLHLNIPKEKHRQIDEVEVTVAPLNAWNEEGEEILEEVKST